MSSGSQVCTRRAISFNQLQYNSHIAAVLIRQNRLIINFSTIDQLHDIDGAYPSIAYVACVRSRASFLVYVAYVIMETAINLDQIRYDTIEEFNEAFFERLGVGIIRLI